MVLRRLLRLSFGLLLVPVCTFVYLLFHTHTRGVLKPQADTSVFFSSLPEVTQTTVRIYVADLPKKYNFNLLNALARSSGGPGQDYLRWISANPHGDLLEATGDGPEGMRHRDNHALDVLFHMQLLRSPLREHNASLADIIYVPFYVHKIAQLKEFYRADYSSIVAQFWQEAPQMLPYMDSKPHWLTVSGPGGDLMNGCGGSSGTDFLCHPGIDRFVWTTPELFTGARVRGDSRSLGPRKQRNPAAVSMPYLSRVRNMRVMRPSRFNLTEVVRSKFLLLTEAMRVHSGMKSQRGLRQLHSMLKMDCLDHEAIGDCAWYDPSPSSTFRSTSHEEDLQMFDPHIVTSLGAQAWFSLVDPTRDIATQAHIWDYFQLDTIPVVLDRHVLALLPFADIIDYQQFMLVMPDTWIGSFAGHVKAAATPTARLEAIQRLRSIRHILEYSMSPNDGIVTFGGVDELDEMDDADTASIKAVVRSLCNRGQLPSRCKQKLPEASASSGLGLTIRPGMLARTKRPRSKLLRKTRPRD